MARPSSLGRAILLFGLTAIAPHGFPQATKGAPTAAEVAKRVDDHYNRLQSLKAGFREKYEGLGMQRTESGTMLLRKPGKMRWDYTSTPGKLFVLDGKYAWFYAPGETQVQRIPAKQLDDLRSPLRFLLGHTKLETELEQLKLEPSAHPGKSPTYTLSGIPKGQQKRIVRLTLSVTQDGTIQQISIEEVDGATTDFEFTGEQPNASIPEAQFHFTPPAGVPVVDALPPV
jgi:outer membrane lipoprotein carrier protein